MTLLKIRLFYYTTIKEIVQEAQVLKIWISLDFDTLP